MDHSGCVGRWNNDEQLRTHMQEHSGTIEDMRKWYTLAAAPVRYKSLWSGPSGGHVRVR